VPLYTHPDALAALERHYKAEDLNDARRKMAIVPKGARLIANPVSAAPGFILENVYVMAGLPRIMQAMLDEVLPTLKGGIPITSRTISTFIPEGTMAAGLTTIQTQFPTLSLGSYPFFQQGRAGTSLVIRGTDKTALDACEKAVQDFLSTFGKE
jgi:molybdopterin-biosynthesis enzyme MoeA-like protein